MSNRGFLLFLFLGVRAFAFDSVQLKKTIPAPAGVKTAELTQIAADSTGRTWVSDPANDQLHHYSADGEYVQSVGHRGSAAGEFMTPHGLAVSTDGHLYIADSGNARVQIFSLDGKYLDAFGQKGSEPGQFRAPWLVSVSRDGV